MGDIQVVGYEGGIRESEYPLLWGAAALRDARGVYNAVLRGASLMSLESWESCLAEGNATATEVPIPVETSDPFFVMSLRLDLMERAPYTVGNFPEMYGIVAVAKGATRGYYVFQSHEKLTLWLYHLHAGAYELVTSSYAAIARSTVKA